MNSYSTIVKHGGGQRRQLEKYRTGHVNLPLGRKKHFSLLETVTGELTNDLTKLNLVSANLAKNCSVGTLSNPHTHLAHIKMYCRIWPGTFFVRGVPIQSGTHWSNRFDCFAVISCGKQHFITINGSRKSWDRPTFDPAG